jgi:hypothetical protein
MLTVFIYANIIKDREKIGKIREIRKIRKWLRNRVRRYSSLSNIRKCIKIIEKTKIETHWRIEIIKKINKRRK